MNTHTELNSELLSADARGKKHIPFAVFAVILIHVVLFVVLLVAAGCRSSARAKANRPAAEPALQPNPADHYMQAAASNAAPVQAVAPTEQVTATEPVVRDEPRFANVPAVTPEASRTETIAVPSGSMQRREARPAARGTPTKTSAARQTFHVVQSGDTVEKIAKLHGTTIQAIKAANKLKGHMIYPGQKLMVKPASAGSTAQARKANASNEV